MRVPRELYQLETALAQHLPTLRPAQRVGLALWVYGTILAQSACQSAVVAALLVVGRADALRQRLREWLDDGADKAAPCHAQVDLGACFAPLLRWVLSWWQAPSLALAIDATLHHDQVTALVVSVLYRGCAIPVAWHILPANRPGAWMSPILGLLRELQPALPPAMRVLVLADRGLWSPRLWGQIQALGWHPLLRIQDSTTFATTTQARAPARALVTPGQAWVGRGKLGSPKRRRLAVTLIAVWAVGQQDPWVVVSDLAPPCVGVSWYGLRIWIELGFRALKGVGWQWQRTRRTDPQRVARYWLVVAVATLWTLAYGTRVEDAAAVGVPPADLRSPPLVWERVQRRQISLFVLGLRRLQHALGRGRLWTRLWLTPEPWPAPPPALQITIVADP